MNNITEMLILIVIVLMSNNMIGQNNNGGTMSLELKSRAFENEEMIPEKFSCDGEDISPELTWSGAPENTKSFALICDDPDAPVGTFVHWVIFNIPADVSKLGENVPNHELLENGAEQGKNDFGKIGYGGPCPPGGTHRYYFKLYALDQKVNLDPGISKDQLLDEIKDNIIDEAQLMGRYER